MKNQHIFAHAFKFFRQIAEFKKRGDRQKIKITENRANGITEIRVEPLLFYNHLAKAAASDYITNNLALFIRVVKNHKNFILHFSLPPRILRGG